jgi:hypothetical protein
MAKITVLEQKTFNGKPSGFKVTLDDGRSGNLEEKQSDKGLRVGDEVAVTEIPYTSKAGNKSTLYGLRLGAGVATTSAPAYNPPVNPTPRPQPSAPVVVPQEATILKMKFESRMKCLELAHNAYLSGKLDDKEALEHCVAWVAVADGLINEITGK